MVQIPGDGFAGRHAARHMGRQTVVLLQVARPDRATLDQVVRHTLVTVLGGVVQRRPVRAVSSVQLGTARHQRPDDIEMTVQCRKVQYTPSVEFIYELEVGAVLEQQVDDVGVATLDRPAQRRVAVAPPQVDIGTVLQQKLRDLQMPARRGVLQRRQYEHYSVDIGALLHEETRHLHVPGRNHQVQTPGPIEGRIGVELGALRHEQPGQIRGARSTLGEESEIDRGHTGRIRRVDVGAALQQQSHGLFLARGRCHMQRSPAVLVHRVH
jgi:hypothetical protein